MLPSTKKRKNIVMKIPVRGFVDLAYTGIETRSISARAGIMYQCVPNSIIRACDVDVEALVSLGYFIR